MGALHQQPRDLSGTRKGLGNLVAGPFSVGFYRIFTLQFYTHSERDFVVQLVAESFAGRRTIRGAAACARVFTAAAKTAALTAART